MTRISRFALPAYLLLEAFVTLQVAERLGAGRTLLLLLLGVAGGLAVLRRERLSILMGLRRAAASRELALPGLLDGAARVVAGLLLIIPGFVSDAIALSLLVPRLRRWLVLRFAAAFDARPAGSVVIEGDYRRIDDPALPKGEREPWRS